MEFARTDPHTVALTGMDSFVCDLLRQIIPSAAPGDHAGAQARLFSSPTDHADAEFDADWQAYVEPDLRAHFAANLSVVERALATLPPPGSAEDAALHLPLTDLDAWVNALNQARLALAARHDVTGEEMESEFHLGKPRGRALFQIAFYGDLQYLFLRELERSV